MHSISHSVIIRDYKAFSSKIVCFMEELLLYLGEDFNLEYYRLGPKITSFIRGCMHAVDCPPHYHTDLLMQTSCIIKFYKNVYRD